MTRLRAEMAGGAGEVQGEGAFEDALVGEVVGPAVGVQDGAAQALVSLGLPHGRWL